MAFLHNSNQNTDRRMLPTIKNKPVLLKNRLILYKCRHVVIGYQAWFLHCIYADERGLPDIGSVSVGFVIVLGSDIGILIKFR